jgi:hypothetical protein
MTFYGNPLKQDILLRYFVRHFLYEKKYFTQNDKYMILMNDLTFLLKCLLNISMNVSFTVLWPLYIFHQVYPQGAREN